MSIIIKKKKVEFKIFDFMLKKKLNGSLFIGNSCNFPIIKQQ